MSGSPGTEISSRHRRHPLNESKRCAALAARIALTCTLLAKPVFGQAPPGPVKITIDEAIQMALQHNHNLLAARTTVQQSEAQEITANLHPNPTLFADWEYLPIFNPSSFTEAYLRD